MVVFGYEGMGKERRIAVLSCQLKLASVDKAYKNQKCMSMFIYWHNKQQEKGRSPNQ